jgi:hypothetical protein
MATKLTLQHLADKLDSQTRLIEDQTEVFREHTIQDAANFARVTAILLGDGDKQVGFVTRLDRLEQEAVKRTWHLRAIWTTIFAFIGNLIISSR